MTGLNPDDRRTDAATVRHLARMFRDGTGAECERAFQDVTDGYITTATWDAAEDLATSGTRIEADDAEGGSS